MNAPLPEFEPVFSATSADQATRVEVQYDPRLTYIRLSYQGPSLNLAVVRKIPRINLGISGVRYHTMHATRRVDAAEVTLIEEPARPQPELATVKFELLPAAGGPPAEAQISLTSWLVQQYQLDRPLLVITERQLKQVLEDEDPGPAAYALLIPRLFGGL